MGTSHCFLRIFQSGFHPAMDPTVDVSCAKPEHSQESVQQGHMGLYTSGERKLVTSGGRRNLRKGKDASSTCTAPPPARLAQQNEQMGFEQKEQMAQNPDFQWAAAPCCQCPSVPNTIGPSQLCSHCTAVQLCKAILAKGFLQSISRRSFANHALSPTQPPGPRPHADTQKGVGFGLQLQWLQGLDASTPQTPRRPRRLKNGIKKYSRYLFWQLPFSG